MPCAMCARIWKCYYHNQWWCMHAVYYHLNSPVTGEGISWINWSLLTFQCCSQWHGQFTSHYAWSQQQIFSQYLYKPIIVIVVGYRTSLAWNLKVSSSWQVHNALYNTNYLQRYLCVQRGYLWEVCFCKCSTIRVTVLSRIVSWPISPFNIMTIIFSRKSSPITVLSPIVTKANFTFQCYYNNYYWHDKVTVDAEHL